MPSWRADLTFSQAKIVEQAKLDAEKAAGQGMTNEEFLLLMATDTSAKWRKA